jgi:HEAT repeat protein
MGHLASEAVPELVSALSQPEEKLFVNQVVVALGRIGDPRAYSAIKAILEWADSPFGSDIVKASATWALERIPHSAGTVGPVGAQDKVDGSEAERKAEDEAAADQKREERGLK